MDITAAAPIAQLIEELNKLPGIGPKSAQRLAYHIIRGSEENAAALALAISSVKGKIVLCHSCQNLTDVDPCIICDDSQRERTIVCVVEQPGDILSLERTRKYRGLYHVLHGAISPINGIGPRDLKIRELMDRLKEGQIREVLLATNPSLEGEATAMYIHRQYVQAGLGGQAALPGVRITRLARGLPAGGDLEYADEVTLSRALEGRQDMIG